MYTQQKGSCTTKRATESQGEGTNRLEVELSLPALTHFTLQAARDVAVRALKNRGLQSVAFPPPQAWSAPTITANGE